MSRFVRFATLVLLLGVTTLEAGPNVHSTFAELKRAYRGTKKQFRLASAQREEELCILKLAMLLRSKPAIDWVVAMTRSTDSVELQRDLLVLLAKNERHNPKVIMLHREMMAADHPLRLRARDFLLEWAVAKGERTWLLRLFETGGTEDRFLAIRGLGRIAAPETPGLLWRMLRDAAWEPRAGTESVVNCGGLALASRAFEGEEAARFLILLQRDKRFRDSDRNALRQATRTWEHGDLTRYIDIRELSHPDGLRREVMARFMGQAGFERARAPLTRLARDPEELIAVRVAAAEALGGLKIARADLAQQLGVLLKDPEEKVRSAAVLGLAHLRVKEAVAALLPLLAGDLSAEVRSELARNENLPADTDWAAWLASKDCPLPRGT